MGRRCKASRVRPGYFITDGETQATYTGREQRMGMWILPFLVSGLFDRGKPKMPVAKEVSTPAEDDGGDAEAGRFMQSVCSETDAPDDADEAKDDEAPSSTAKNDKANRKRPQFDWHAYRVAFPETPLHAAVTAMFSEYALLVGRMTRRLGVAARQPMTLSEGASIANQSQDFIFGYVNPILGHLKTTKIHRVLCHVLDAVRYHGSIMNANTSSNEMGHKHDKRHYARTNKREGYTRQLVKHAHGTRKVLRQNAEVRRQEDRAAKKDSGYVADNEMVGAQLQRARTGHLKHEHVRQLSTRPGLSALPAVLGVPGSRRVAVLAHMIFEAQVACGKRRQVVRTSPSFHEKQWYDHKEYRSVGTASAGDLQYGKVRLIVRTADDVDKLVMSEMERVVGAEECPLSTRSCTQLQWSTRVRDHDVDSDREVKLRSIPVTDVVPVVHIVPDCADMGRRESIGVAPPTFGSSGERLWRMRYLLNAFQPDTEQ